MELIAIVHTINQDLQIEPLQDWVNWQIECNQTICPGIRLTSLALNGTILPKIARQKGLLPLEDSGAYKGRALDYENSL